MNRTESKGSPRAASGGYWVYIARMRDGRFYVGHTNNITRRPQDHVQEDGSRTTRIFGFDQIIYAEPRPDLVSAVTRERQLKGWTHAKKLALARGDLQELKQLARSKTLRGKRQKRELHGLNADGIVACNPRDREAAHRALVEGIATADLSAVTCKKCLRQLYRARREARRHEL